MVHRGDAPACFGLIDDIVVVERAEVDKLHGYTSFDWPCAIVPTEFGSYLCQQRAVSLPASGKSMLRDFSQEVGFCDRHLLKSLLHSGHSVPNARYRDELLEDLAVQSHALRWGMAMVAQGFQVPVQGLGESLKVRFPFPVVRGVAPYTPRGAPELGAP